MIYVVISVNRSFFTIRFLQGFKRCAQKMEVVEMDETSKSKLDLNRCLGTCHNALQYENMHFSFKRNEKFGQPFKFILKFR